jgi:hypothetical protein
LWSDDDNGGLVEEGAAYDRALFDERLKGVPHADNDPAVSAVSSPLVEEIGRRDVSVGNAEIARVRQIVKFGAKLEIMVLAQFRVLEDAEIHVAIRGGTQDIPAHIADGIGRRYWSKQAGASCSQEFLNRHPRQIDRGVDVCPHSCAQRCHSAARIRAGQSAERRARL